MGSLSLPRREGTFTSWELVGTESTLLGQGNPPETKVCLQQGCEQDKTPPPPFPSSLLLPFTQEATPCPRPK